MIRFLPGFVAAAAAFVVLKLISWVGYLWLEAAVFIGVYGFVAICLDVGMRKYGEGG